MKTMVVPLTIKSEHVEAFREALLTLARASAEEPGNIRYEVYQSEAHPTRMVLVEVYADQAAVDAHFNAPHFLAWREAASDMIAESAGEVYIPLFPTD